jgi:hypothetical protein
MKRISCSATNALMSSGVLGVSSIGGDLRRWSVLFLSTDG